MNALIIFVLLLVLMLTGMPISISLGLTVLTFLFTMTSVPIESVALMLFTGIEKFEIMAIPFFIFAGDLMVRVVARSNTDLQRVIDRVLAEAAIVRSSTVIALATQVPYRVLPLATAPLGPTGPVEPAGPAGVS